MDKEGRKTQEGDRRRGGPKDGGTVLRDLKRAGVNS